MGGGYFDYMAYAASPSCANRAQLRMAACRSAPTPMSATLEYVLFEVIIDGQKSAVDPADPGSTECAGCLDPAMIVLESCALDGFNGDAIIMAFPQTRNHVFWQGWGCFPDCLCNTVTTRRATWGMLKSLYR